jgi:hypothetical protein
LNRREGCNCTAPRPHRWCIPHVHRWDPGCVQETQRRSRRHPRRQLLPSPVPANTATYGMSAHVAGQADNCIARVRMQVSGCGWRTLSLSAWRESGVAGWVRGASACTVLPWGRRRRRRGRASSSGWRCCDNDDEGPRGTYRLAWALVARMSRIAHASSARAALSLKLQARARSLGRGRERDVGREKDEVRVVSALQPPPVHGNDSIYIGRSPTGASMSRPPFTKWQVCGRSVRSAVQKASTSMQRVMIARRHRSYARSDAAESETQTSGRLRRPMPSDWVNRRPGPVKGMRRALRATQGHPRHSEGDGESVARPIKTEACREAISGEI